MAAHGPDDAVTSCSTTASLRCREAAAEENQRDVDASTQTCLEDKAICEAVQRNLEAGAYADGLLAPRHEAGVADFQARVRRARA